MLLATELALVVLAGIAVFLYGSDSLYWIYENELEKKQKEAEKQEEEKENEKAEEIRKQIAETLYS